MAHGYCRGPAPPFRAWAIGTADILSMIGEFGSNTLFFFWSERTCEQSAIVCFPV